MGFDYRNTFTSLLRLFINAGLLRVFFNSMIGTRQFFGILVISFSTLTTEVSAVSVECTHTTPVCDCPTDADLCEFYLDIQHLQTFTRYEVSNGNRGAAGRVWYIDEATGEFLAHGQPNGTMKNETNCKICYDITENSTDCTEAFAVDGYTFRSFIGINGRIPGPTLIVNKDQYIKVYVSNRLKSETVSIHWHGMHQRNSHWMDGVERVTQCGISPETSFTYIFQATPSGTHWYHSHSGAQRTEGLFGALIVRESGTRISQITNKLGTFQDLPDQHTLTFLDWQYENSIDLFTQIHSSIRFFNESRSPGNNIKEPPRTYSSDVAEVGPVTYWSGLINGRGRHSTVNYTQTRLSVFSVKPNNVYRFRLIGAQSLFAYRVSIDEHKLTVIATDGSFVQPVVVDYIIIHSGERYDFLLKTKNESVLQNRYDFMIRAETLETIKKFKCPKKEEPTMANVAEAILHYDNGTNEIPKSSDYESISTSSKPIVCTSSTPCIALNCPFKIYNPSSNINCIHVHQLKTMFPPESLPDVQNANELFLNFGFEGAGSTSAINARNLQLPSSPLSQLLSDSERERKKEIEEKEFCMKIDDPNQCDDDLQGEAVIRPECECTHVHTIEKDRSIQLVISTVGPNTSSNSIENSRFAHPVHLHGHYFHVVDIRFGEYDNKSGELMNLNQDINCTGQNLCTKPKWAMNVSRDYSTEITNAPLKDTILVPFGGYAVVYFKADNPGYWYLHCHIEVHQLEGMGVIISEAVNEATIPPEGMQRQCGNYQLTLEEFESARNGEQSGGGGGGGLSGLEIGLIAALCIVFLFFCVSLIINLLCLLKRYLSKDN